MGWLLSLLAFLIGSSLGLDAMEEAACLSKELFPEDNSTRERINYKTSRSIDSLRNLAFNAYYQYCKEKKAPLTSLTVLAPDIAESQKKRIMTAYHAPAWFDIFGDLYKPAELALKGLKHTKMSPNNEFLFEFDESQTLIYPLDDLVPLKSTRLDGELIAVSLDSKYIMVRVKGGIDFYAIPDMDLSCSYRGPFDVESDLIVMNSDKTVQVIQGVKGKTDLPIPHYFVSSKSFEKIKELRNSYVFNIGGLGYKGKLIFWGSFVHKPDPHIIVPRTFARDAKGKCALMRTRFEGKWGSESHLYFCDFEKNEITTFIPHAVDAENALNKEVTEKIIACGSGQASINIKAGYFFAEIHSISSNGQFAALGNGNGDMFIFDISTLSRFRPWELLTLEHLKAYIRCPEAKLEENGTSEESAITQLAISSQGNLVLSLADLAAYRVTEGHLPWAMGEDGPFSATDNVVVRLHSWSGSQNISGLVRKAAKQNEIIRHIGFNKKGNKFFICSNKKFSVYTISELVPPFSWAEFDKLIPLIEAFTRGEDFSAGTQRGKQASDCISALADTSFKSALF